MLELLKWLMSQISSVTDKIVSDHEPKDDLGPDEVVLTTLSGDEKKAFALMAIKLERAKNMASIHMLQHTFNQDLPKKECEKVHKDIASVINGISMVRSVLWYSINKRTLRFPKAVAIRKGWQVVEVDYNESGDNFSLEISVAPKFPPISMN